MMSIWLIFGVFMLLSWLISRQLNSRIEKYKKIPIEYGMTGRDIAEKMLADYGIHDVRIISTPGSLTDHYNPSEKTVNLSPDVYHGSNVSAAAVAAHECGHAIQHAHAYSFLEMRSALVPVVSFASKWVQWVLLAGILLVQTFPALLLVGIVLFGLTTLFSVITLPVEVDASKRALTWLQGAGITNNFSHDKAQDALRWAAYTYFVAALSSIATLLYYVLVYLGVNNDD